MHLRLCLAAAALATVLAAPAWAQNANVGNLSVDAAWTRATAPRALNGSVFMTIYNDGEEADRLVSASTPEAIRTELHTHATVDGVTRMRPVEDGIEVPAAGMVELAPGGRHIMLLGLTATLAEGAMIPVTLTFEHAGTVTVDVPVGGASATGPADGGARR